MSGVNGVLDQSPPFTKGIHFSENLRLPESRRSMLKLILRVLRIFAIWIFLLPILAGEAQTQSRAADLVLINGHVITMNPRQPTAQAIAIWQERIAWVGSN